MTSYRKTMREVREEMLQNEAAGDLNDLKKVVAELEKASKMHLEQSKRVQAHVDMMTSAMAKNEEFELKEQPEHEIKVGGYTTKFFYMCGSAQKVMSKNADVEGAEELTRMQDAFYKLEKEVMDAGEATDEQKEKARNMYNQIMKKAGEIGLADDIDDYMKMHIDSIEKGDPKLGFGRTDMKEEKGPRQLVNPNKEIMVVKKNKVVVIDKKDKDKYMKKGWTLAEAKYDLYHKDFSSAMQHSYKMAKKLYGITVDPKEIDDKVASGPRKPSEGKTNSYRLKGDKGAIQVQVYNKGGSKPFELNMYKEEVEFVLEGGDYKSKADAMAAAAASYAKQRDPLDEIEVYKMSGNKFEINHPMNSSGRDSIQKRGGKLIARVGKNYKEEAELDEAKQKPYVSSDRDGFHVMNGSGKIAKSFKDKKLAQAYFKKNYDKLMKEKLDKEDEPIVKAVVKMLKKASNAHAGQAKDLEKAVKEDSENEGFASDAQRRAAFASGYKEKGKKKKNEGAIGGLIGGAIGAATGGPVGAYKGMKIGSKVGDAASTAAKVAGAAYLAKKGYDAAGKKKKEPNNEGTINEILPALAGTAVRAAAPYVAGYALRKIVGDGKNKKKGNAAPNAPATESAASDARRAMASDPSTKQKFSKNVSATDDDVKAADKNIIMQMRKAVSLRGNKVEFMDKKKVMIPQKIAQAVIAKYNNMKKPADKEKFQSKI